MPYDAPLTVLKVRQLLWKYATPDPSDGDGVFLASLNQALERINSAGIWPGSKVRMSLLDYIEDHLLTLPYAYDALIGVLVDDYPLDIVPQELEFSGSGPGLLTEGEGGRQFVDLGFIDVTEDDETLERRRYKVLPEITDSTDVEGLLHKRFVYLTEDTDRVFPSNIAALKYSLLAISMEDQADLARAEVLWGKCYEVLNAQKTHSMTGMQIPVKMQPFGAGASGVTNLM